MEFDYYLGGFVLGDFGLTVMVVVRGLRGYFGLGLLLAQPLEFKLN